MEEKNPLVSVIMPMRNTERFVIPALNSILRSKELAIEIIVVDDKSTDQSVNRVREVRDRRIRLLEGNGRGAANAMNLALAQARGEIIMCCDSDDLFPAERISQQTAWLQSHMEYDAVCGNYSTIDSDGNEITLLRCGTAFADITDELAGGKVRAHLCTYAIRSSFVRRVAGFREFFISGYDIDFQLRCGELGRIAFVPENWYTYRIHNSSIIHTQSSAMMNFYERTAYELQKQRHEFGIDDIQKGNPPPKPTDDRSLPFSATAHIQGQLIGQAWHEHRAGNKIGALRFGFRAVATDPLQMGMWRSLIAMILKPSRTASS
jgi:glycosyltransferase involved in cell wall biosynthesis